MLFWELFEQLRKVGAKLILVVTGHYGPCQVDCLKGVADDFNRCHPDIHVTVQPEYEGVEVDGETPADHAGKWEISMFWYMYPHLTVLEDFKPGRIKVHNYPDAPYNYYRENPVWEWREDLRTVASRELGRKAVEAIVDHLVELVRRRLEELEGC